MKKQENKGITLIALVITIIVLLILAGVSIATLTGPNGLLTQATEAKKATKDAEMKERVEVEVAGSYGVNGKISKEKLEENLKNLEGAELTDAEEGEDFSWKVTVDGYVFNVWNTGKVESAGTIPEKPFENTIKPGEIVTEEQGNTEYRNNGRAIIPVGFCIVPGCEDVSEGLVISDSENDTEIEGQDIVTKGNQFVWIPVKKSNDYKRNTKYEMVYESEDISNKRQYDIGYLPFNDVDIGIEEETEEGKKGELIFEKEKDLVTSKGGFYISRYEAGKEETETLVSKKGVNVWGSIAQEEAKTTAKTFKDNSNVKSALASGVQWDMVMAFVNGKKDGNEELYDVTKYLPSRHTGDVPTLSGQNDADKVCNIYDLEGNYVEYLAEKNAADTDINHDCSCIKRGGASAEPNPASSGYASKGTVSGNASFRFVLYII